MRGVGGNKEQGGCSFNLYNLQLFLSDMIQNTLSECISEGKRGDTSGENKESKYQKRK